MKTNMKTNVNTNTKANEGANLHPRALLQRMFAAAIEAAQPAHCIPPLLPEVPVGRLIVIGAGKASAAMARAVEDNWTGALSGLVVTRYGYAVPDEQEEKISYFPGVPYANGHGQHASVEMGSKRL